MCISWTIKCLILLMHGATTKFNNFAYILIYANLHIFKYILILYAPVDFVSQVETEVLVMNKLKFATACLNPTFRLISAPD